MRGLKVLLTVESGFLFDKTIFLTKDIKDFNHIEIHEELSSLGVKIMFSSGECVREVLKLLQT